MPGLGKILVLVGAILIVVGVLLAFFDRIPFLGKLPGDIHVKKENFELYIPLTTAIILSLVVSGILWLMSRKP